jgi:hypothetical protein
MYDTGNVSYRIMINHSHCIVSVSYIYMPIEYFKVYFIFRIYAIDN